MEVKFVNENPDIKSIIKTENDLSKQILLENNLKQLGNLYNFYKSKLSVMLVNGFIGCGKTAIVNFSTSFLNKESIILECQCFETTILDDILLSFFEDFKNLTSQGVIAQPKIKTENFTQKVFSYFNSINAPILIVINSFDSILKNNKQEILDFIFHISQIENIKIVIVSRTFEYEDFQDKVNFAKTTILALEKNLFEKLLRADGIKMIGPVSDELYKHSRGYFLYTKLTTKIINAHKLSLIDFIDSYTKSFLSYNDFILREALAFVDPTSGHLFRLLTILRHPISVRLLQKINMYDEQKIQFFIDNLILTQEKDMIYLQDYYKSISENSIPENVSVKLHKSCVDLYSTQLPLKPFERDLLISRQTMRAEIEYHTLFLPKRFKLTKPVDQTQIEAVEYSANSVGQVSIASAQNAGNNSEDKDIQDKKLKQISFIFETEAEEQEIMDGIASSINEFIDYSNKILTSEETNLPFMEIINSANKAERVFNFKKALAFYQLALTLKDDENFPKMVSRIYTKTAKCYEQLSDWFNALKYYDLALEYFVTFNDIEKINSVKFAIANVYFNTYKPDKAEALLVEVLGEDAENLSSETKIKSHLLLAAIKTQDIKEAYKNYKIAFELITPSTTKKTLAELYFKFAAVCDDLGETETAIKLYKRCLDIKEDNSYISSALLNLAMIFDDTGAENLAITYYKEGLQYNADTKNLHGEYNCAVKIAQILQYKNKTDAEEFFKLAIAKAKEINDAYYIITSHLLYGDFCLNLMNFQKTLKQYLIALSTANKRNCPDLKKEIEQRIRDLKARLGEEKFKQLEQEIIKK